MDMAKIRYLWMEPEEVTKIVEIDRSERIRMGYKLVEGKLQKMAVNWDSPPWTSDGEGEYSVAGQIKFCREHLERNGRLFGAFLENKLVGIGLLQPEVEEGIAQLAFLHVSNQHRRMGIGSRITKELVLEAKRGGASKMYVSATPSGSAVSFYLRQGFKPTNNPIPVLLELEPDDIHMIKNLLAQE